MIRDGQTHWLKNQDNQTRKLFISLQNYIRFQL